MVASSGTWGKGQNVTFLPLQLIKKITWMLSWLLGLCICSLAVSFLLWLLSPWLCPCVCLVSVFPLLCCYYICSPASCVSPFPGPTFSSLCFIFLFFQSFCFSSLPVSSLCVWVSVCMCYFPIVYILSVSATALCYIVVNFSLILDVLFI